MPGGVSNLVPGAGVLALIGGVTLIARAATGRHATRSRRSTSLAGPVLDRAQRRLRAPVVGRWWQERGWRGDANDIPVLMIDGFFDVESRGAFQAYQALRGDGAHLLMAGGHDGAPVGTDGGAAEAEGVARPLRARRATTASRRTRGCSC